MSVPEFVTDHPLLALLSLLVFAYGYFSLLRYCQRYVQAVVDSRTQAAHALHVADTMSGVKSQNKTDTLAEEMVRAQDDAAGKLPWHVGQDIGLETTKGGHLVDSKSDGKSVPENLPTSIHEFHDSYMIHLFFPSSPGGQPRLTPPDYDRKWTLQQVFTAFGSLPAHLPLYVDGPTMFQCMQTVIRLTERDLIILGSVLKKMRDHWANNKGDYEQRLEELNDSFSEDGEKMRKLSTDHDKFKQAYSHERDRRKDAEEQVDALKGQLLLQQKAMTRGTKDMYHSPALDDRLKKLEDDMETERTARAAVERELEQKRNDLTYLEESIAQKEKDVEDERMGNQELKRQLTDMEAKIRILESDSRDNITTMNEESKLINDLRKTLRRKDDIIRNFRDEIRTLSAEKEELSELLDQAREETKRENRAKVDALADMATPPDAWNVLHLESSTVRLRQTMAGTKDTHINLDVLSGEMGEFELREKARGEHRTELTQLKKQLSNATNARHSANVHAQRTARELQKLKELYPDLPLTGNPNSRLLMQQLTDKDTDHPSRTLASELMGTAFHYDDEQLDSDEDIKTDREDNGTSDSNPDGGPMTLFSEQTSTTIPSSWNSSAIRQRGFGSRDFEGPSPHDTASSSIASAPWPRKPASDDTLAYHFEDGTQDDVSGDIRPIIARTPRDIRSHVNTRRTRTLDDKLRSVIDDGAPPFETSASSSSSSTDENMRDAGSDKHEHLQTDRTSGLQLGATQDAADTGPEVPEADTVHFKKPTPSRRNRRRNQGSGGKYVVRSSEHRATPQGNYWTYSVLLIFLSVTCLAHGWFRVAVSKVYAERALWEAANESTLTMFWTEDASSAGYFDLFLNALLGPWLGGSSQVSFTAFG